MYEVSSREKSASLLTAIGLASVVALVVASGRMTVRGSVLVGEGFDVNPTERRETSEISLIAFGDVNLGRRVGQEILKGDTLYPFVDVKDSMSRFDIVFANLESQLSDQHGRTEHPRNNLIFTGPPAGAFTLKNAGITIVSTANNHALDYGVKALRETIQFLDEAGVLHVGTSEDSASLFKPVVLVRKGVRIAFFACTDVMNFEYPLWKRSVADADTAKLLPAIRNVRDSVDLIIVSYHGGEEYADRATNRTKEFARQVISCGADLFLGHHPHVPYGVELYEAKYIVHSLGNFVFRQPDRFWTQRSFAFAVTIVKDSDGTRVASAKCIPVLAGFQPTFADDRSDIELVLERIRALSTQSLAQQLSW